MKKGRIPMNLELFEKARALGEAMAQTDEYKAVQAAQTQLDADEEAQALIGQYNGLQTTMQELMQAENPDRDAVAALASSMRQIQGQLTQMPAMQALNEAQTAFADVLNSVNQVLRFIITGQTGDADGCGANCAGCKGCE